MMWFLLNFIPDGLLTWLIHIVVAIGFVLQFAGLVRSVPGIAPYAIVAKQLGIVILCVGLFLEGDMYAERGTVDRIKELQAKLAVAEQQSKDTNQKLNDALTNNRNLIKNEVSKNARDIEAKRQSINSGCSITNDAWLLYNRAVEPKVSGSSPTTNGSSTRVSPITRK